MAKFIQLTGIIICCISITACSCRRVTTGIEPDPNPPRLVAIDNTNFTGWNDQTLSNVRWDRPRAFGLVPVELIPVGNNLCNKAGFYYAGGYHPKALGLDNMPIPGGAFLCLKSIEQRP